MYRKPIQDRSAETEKRLLDALSQILEKQSFEQTSVEHIAEQANCTKSAFFKRFGSKEAALIKLFEDYADEASRLIRDVTAAITTFSSCKDCLQDMSLRFEALLFKHFAANRGMNELYKRQLESHEATQKIFYECVQLMSAIKQHFFGGAESEAEVGSFAATQLFVSLNFHYVMRQMPGMPSDKALRHHIISDVVVLALQK